MVAKQMRNFDPSKKRSTRSNYYGLLEDEMEEYNEEFCGNMREGPFRYHEAMATSSADEYHKAMG